MYYNLYIILPHKSIILLLEIFIRIPHNTLIFVDIHIVLYPALVKSV